MTRDYNREWSEEDAIKAFEDMLEYALNDENCLCMQDACIHIEMPGSTFRHLTKKFKTLAAIKEDLQGAIISRVNRGSLNNKMNVTAAIWRQKQMGEQDKRTIEHEGNTGSNQVVFQLPPNGREED